MPPSNKNQHHTDPITLKHFKQHELDDAKRFQEMTDAINERPTTTEMKVLLRNAFDEMISTYFLTKGGKIKSWIMSAGILMGSIVAIFVGIKSVLGWLGILITRG